MAKLEFDVTTVDDLDTHAENHGLKFSYVESGPGGGNPMVTVEGEADAIQAFLEEIGYADDEDDLDYWVQQITNVHE